MNIITAFANIEGEGSVDIESSLPFLCNNSEITKAGNTIRSYMNHLAPKGENSSDKEQESFFNALVILRSYREFHLPYLKEMENLVKNKLKRLNIIEESIVASRSKRLESIASKLVRLPSTRLPQMEDLVGIRVTFLTIDDLNKFLHDKHCEILEDKCIGATVKEQDYIKTPKKDGYRGIHKIFKYQTDLSQTIKIELQLRTQIQHEWATIVEILGTLNNISFKIGQGSQEYRFFLELVSVLFSIAEGLPTISKYSSLTPKEVCHQLQKIDAELEILKILSSVKSIPIQSDEQEQYYLLILDLSKNETIIQAYSDESKANDIYVQLENMYKSNDKFDVVLISSIDVKKIKDAYPNYFMHTKKFIVRYNKLLKQYA